MPPIVYELPVEMQTGFSVLEMPVEVQLEKDRADKAVETDDFHLFSGVDLIEVPIEIIIKERINEQTIHDAENETYKLTNSEEDTSARIGRLFSYKPEMIEEGVQTEALQDDPIPE